MKHIDELFGESTNSSESEEETIADVARGAKLKRQLSVRTRTIQEVEEESESEQQHVEMPPTPEIFPADREPSPIGTAVVETTRQPQGSVHSTVQ